MASTVLTRTPSGTGNQKKWTYSIWFKRQHTNTESALFSVGDNPSTNMCMLRFDPDKINFYSNDTNAGRFSTNQLFRDINGFYHVVLAYDSANATTDNRVKLYVNGQRISTSDMTGVNTVVQNTDSIVNSTSTIYIGERPDDNAHFDGIMSHIHFCDGYAYDATAFGEYDANGVWTINTSPSVTYGTNGFFILKNGNSVTDQSGNGNNFTVAGGTLTNTESSPSNVFATLNPLYNAYVDPIFSNGNLKITQTSGWCGAKATMGVSTGKWYWEIKLTGTMGSHMHGVQQENVNESAQNPMNLTGTTVFYNDDGGEMRTDGTQTTADYGTFSSGDIMGLALDMEAGSYGQITIYKNGSAIVSNFNLSSSSTTVMPFSAIASNGTTEYNFGNGYFGTTAVSSAGTNASGIGIFEYDVPTGYTALSTKGLNL